MSVTINGTSGLVFNDASTQSTAAKVGMVNRIINGAMVIDQRNAGASVTPTDGQYTLDRWQATLSQSSKFSVQQNAGAVTRPAGFVNYLGCTSLSAYSVGATETFAIQQKIEGFSIADLGFGTANAQTITLSFQVYSSLTGTFGGALSTGGYARSYPFSYSIPVANTWTTISVTIAGDTSGTYATGNTEGLRLAFSLGSGTTRSGTAGSWSSSVFTNATGATSVVGTNGATFYITGVQLEKGSTATSFDARPYGTELHLCQRYCQVISRSQDSFSIGLATKQQSIYFVAHLSYQTMRASPTWANTPTTWTTSSEPTSTQANTFDFSANGFATITGTFSVFNQLRTNQGRLYYVASSSFSGGSGGGSFALGLGQDPILTAEL